jgi:hypothetical protein
MYKILKKTDDFGIKRLDPYKIDIKIIFNKN